MIKLKEKQLVTVIIALFNSEDEVLILQRGSTAPWMPNMWSLVGGIVDPGENNLRALKREVKEETQLSVSDISYVGSKKEDWGTLEMYIGYARGKVILDWENQDYVWITKYDLNKYKFVPSVKEFLLDIFNS